MLQNPNVMASDEKEWNIGRWKWQTQHRMKKLKFSMQEKGGCVNAIP
jgi:hypothetical protein